MKTFARLIPSAAVALCFATFCTAAETRESTTGPDYTDAPETKAQPGIATGTLHDFTMDSKDSRIYPGIAKGQTGVVPYQRKVSVYVPAGDAPAGGLPFVVVQDGLGYRDVMSKVLDNLIAAKRVPAMAAIFINSGGGDAQGSERGLEYDTVSGLYAEFIEKEVLPLVTKECGIKLTADPEGRATMGGSSGAAAAFTMAWFHPELYRKVLSYSGTYVNQQSPLNPESPHGAWEYHEHLIPNTPAKPIRIWLQVSEKDNGWDRDEASLHNWVMANERMTAALKAKEYDYRYMFSKNAGHTDRKVTRETLPTALEWLWRGYPAK